MFPQLDLAKVNTFFLQELNFEQAKIHNTKKAVLLNLDSEKDVIDFRYYGLRVSHTGINKNVN